MWKPNKCKKFGKELLFGRSRDKTRDRVLHGLVFFSILYVIIVTIQNGNKNVTNNVRFGKATGGQSDPCLLPEEGCREEHLRKHLDGLTDWNERNTHPRYKYEDLIGTIKCSEWYILNMTECHGSNEVLEHEDFYCKQKVVQSMKQDYTAYKVLIDHCKKYNFPIKREEFEDLEHLSLF